MSEHDLIFLAFSAPVIALCLGFIIGGRQSDAYWASHGDDGGSVHHKGQFYRVTREGRR